MDWLRKVVITVIVRRLLFRLLLHLSLRLFRCLFLRSGCAFFSPRSGK